MAYGKNGHDRGERTLHDDTTSPTQEGSTREPYTMSQDDSDLTFPKRLMLILNDERNHEAIDWQPDGKSFLIVNKNKLSTDVLPRYFRKIKYSSFIRKLNRWYFCRIRQGPLIGSYRHPHFLRDDPRLCSLMYCKNERAPTPQAHPAPVLLAQPTTTASTASTAAVPARSDVATSPVSVTQPTVPVAQDTAQTAQILAALQHQRSNVVSSSLETTQPVAHVNQQTPINGSVALSPALQNTAKWILLLQMQARQLLAQQSKADQGEAAEAARAKAA